MNRAERRRTEKAAGKTPVVNIRAEDVKEIKNKAAAEATDIAFRLMLCLPVTVLHDKYGFGPKRCQAFTEAVLGLYDSFCRGYITLEDLGETLLEETGVELVGGE